MTAHVFASACLLSLATFALAAAAGPTDAGPAGPTTREARLAAAEALRAAVTDVQTLEAEPAKLELLRRRAAAAIEPLAGRTHVTDALQHQLTEANADELPALLAAATAAADDLAFEPTMEAEFPEGFPPYTPVGEVRVKTYPAARLAQAFARDGAMFFRLFRHINTNEVAMTTPVVMGTDADRGATMGFYYEAPAQGDAGAAADDVQVVDVPPTRVVSIGVRGNQTRAATDAAVARLDAWLAANPQEQAVGEPRVMGYNSPFMSRDKRFFEVQYVLADGE
ncbi:MAG: heme-binding protein [Phycisphaerae bacterium]